MADVKAIRDRLKTNLRTTFPTTLYLYDTFPAQPMVPCVAIAPATEVMLSEVTLEGAEDLTLVATVLVRKVIESAAQDDADDYLSEGSSNIANALDSGSTADWDYVVALPARGYGQYVFGEGENTLRYLGFQIPLAIGVS
jgi:hypothetical protein